MEVSLEQATLMVEIPKVLEPKEILLKLALSLDYLNVSSMFQQEEISSTIIQRVWSYCLLSKRGEQLKIIIQKFNQIQTTEGIYKYVFRVAKLKSYKNSRNF